MPGYPSELFLVEPPELYICGICFDILKSPQRCPQGYIYCSECIRTHLAIRGSCPICACQLSWSIVTSNLLVREGIDGLHIWCPTTVQDQSEALTGGEEEPARCSWTGALEAIDHHLNTYCPYTEVVCPTGGCGLRSQRRHLALHTTVCDHSRLRCNDCLTIVKRMHREIHDDVCTMRPVRCPLGCELILLRHDVVDHITADCPKLKVACPSGGRSVQPERRVRDSHARGPSCGSRLVRHCDFIVPITRVGEGEHHAINCCPEWATVILLVLVSVAACFFIAGVAASVPSWWYLILLLGTFFVLGCAAAAQFNQPTQVTDMPPTVISIS